MTKIENWYVKRGGSRYTAPELAREYLFGDNEIIIDLTTTTEISGKKITVGSKVYILGEPLAGYLQFLKDTGYKFDPENPIKDRRNEN